MKMKRIIAKALLLLFCGDLQSEPHFASIFGDNAVLQSGPSTKVWGFGADPSGDYTLQFGDRSAEATVLGNGLWKATLSNLPRSADPKELTLLESGKAVVSLRDIVVGEIWLAAGQSNMQMQVKSMRKDMPPAQDWVDSASLPQVRFRRVNDPVLSDSKREATDLATSAPWIKMSPESVPEFSAAAAVFARQIAEELQCPVGIIDVSWGGKPIEPFIPRKAFTPPFLSRIKELADENKLDDLKQLRGGVIIRNPEGYPGAIFNARIAPLTQYGLAGFIWYQAESNAGKGEDPRRYRHKMAALADGWRARWKDDSLPLLFVQLPSFPKATGWIRAREEQRLSLEIPHTSMAVTIDIRGEGIHPPDKLEVGKRLARCALKNTYNIKDIVASGPRCTGHKANGSKLIVRFSETHGGLRSGNRPLFSAVEFSETKDVKWFEVAGADGEWHEASAHIAGETVIVASDQEPSPVSVRYACGTTPQGSNLYNGAGLPASPFCSDLELLEWDDHGKEK